MKKKNVGLLAIIIVMIGFFSNIVKTKAVDLNAYAYQIALIKYTGSGNTTEVGKMLVYNPALFEVYTSKRGSAPGSYGALCSGIGVSQMVPDIFADDGSVSLGKGVSLTVDVGENTVLGNNKALNLYKGLAVFETNSCLGVSVSGVKSKDPESGITDWFEKIYKYMSAEKTITWSPPSTGGWHTAIADSNLTENAVSNQNYLDVLFDRYANTASKIRQYFGVTINYREMDQYYVEFVPVERLEGSFSVTGSYIAKTFYQVTRERDEWNGGTWNSYECCDVCTKTCYDECYTKTGVPYRCNKHECTYKCNCDTCYSLPTQVCGTRNKHLVFGQYADGETYLQVVTSGGKLNRAVNLCSEEKNKHCELEDDNVTCKRDKNGNIIYQYYVGPNLEKALVGTEGYNKYKLKGSCTNQSPSVGKKEYYLINDWADDCQSTCKASGSTRSDEYLKCAENYCDAEVDFELKGNARIRKKNCILSCGYSYGKDPVTGSTTSPNRESYDSCTNSNPYKNDERRYTGSSKCNTGERYTPMREETAVAVSCSGDHVTDFDNNDTNDTIFDMRTYVNIACKESTSFDYTDLSNTTILAGEDIEYLAKLLGEKECTVYFNLEQWKFDYATVSGKDPDRRKRLQYVYTVFNNALIDEYKKESNRYYDPDFAAERMGEVDWNELEYDPNKISVMSKVTEIVNNKEETKGSQKLNIEEYTDKTEQNVWFKDSGEQSKSKVTKISKMSLTTDAVNKYISKSKVEAEYRFDKVCTTTDGKASVYKATSDVCYTLKDGTEKLAKNTYYTNLAATPNEYFSETIKKANKGHNIQTTVTVGRDVVNSDVYYDNTEKCEYKVTKNPQDVKCEIIITPNEDTQKLGNDIYEGSGVTAKVWYYEELGANDGIASVAMEVNGRTYTTDSRSLSIERVNDSNEEFNINGVVTTKGGAVVECPKKIIVMNHTGCGLGCRLDKKNDRLYEIVSTGSRPEHYYQSLSTNMNKVEVFSSAADGKHYVRLDSSLNDVTIGHKYNANILFGYVYTSSCNNYCRTDLIEPEPDCTKLYNASETAEIRSYCEANYEEDVDNYGSIEECVTKCSLVRECPEDRRDEKTVRQFCSANYIGLGYYDLDSCMNRCYYDGLSGKDYVFRPVSTLDPFPNSEESYIKGNRAIGKNWYGGFSKYITEDNDDKSSVTGASANQNVEYIIELNPQEIRKVRENSKNYGVSAYTDYIYASTYDTKYVGRYQSKFIREDFRDIFKTSVRSGQNTIIALGDLD